MFGFKKKDKVKIDGEIRNELDKIRKLSTEEVEKIYGGTSPLLGDTREEYTMNQEEINRSIYGALLNN